jgi:hypothetical protein
MGEKVTVLGERQKSRTQTWRTSQQREEKERLNTDTEDAKQDPTPKELKEGTRRTNKAKTPPPVTTVNLTSVLKVCIMRYE